VVFLAQLTDDDEDTPEAKGKAAASMQQMDVPGAACVGKMIRVPLRAAA